jgi:glyoxylate reductase
MDFKVLVTKKLPEEGLSKLRERCKVYMYTTNSPITQKELLKFAPVIDAIIPVGTKINAEFIGKAKKLKIISNYGVGYDNIDVEAANKKGIPVTNLPYSVTESTAELTMSLMLAVSRRIIEADNYVRTINDGNWYPTLLMGHELYTKKLGIIGFGRIGQAVAKRACGFGMDLYYYDIKHQDSDELGKNVKFLPFGELIKQMDYITLHVPYLKETHYLIAEKEFKSMKKSVYLINVSRGLIVDQKALVEALKNKVITGAALDVFETEPQVPAELCKLKNVVLTPHIGTSTLETRIKMAIQASDKIIQIMKGEMPENIINKKELKRRKK